MIYHLYSIKDNCAGEFTPVFCSSSDSVAIREFVLSVMNIPEFTTKDYDLYILGSFDSVLGIRDFYEPEKIFTGTEAIERVKQFKNSNNKDKE